MFFPCNVPGETVVEVECGDVPETVALIKMNVEEELEKEVDVRESAKENMDTKSIVR